MLNTLLLDSATDNRSAEAHRQAYNAAFEELGLACHWDSATDASVESRGPGGLRNYLEAEHPHLLRAYEAAFLVEAIECAKARCHAAMTSSRPLMARPGGVVSNAPRRA